MADSLSAIPMGTPARRRKRQDRTRPSHPNRKGVLREHETQTGYGVRVQPGEQGATMRQRASYFREYRAKRAASLSDRAV